MIQLLSVADMRESDSTTIAQGTDSKILMYRAGEAIFNEIKHFPSPFGIICGNGNNAGDGYVLALLLNNAGIDCSIYRITERFSTDGKYYYDKCVAQGITDNSSLPLSDFLSSNSTLVDCIFGTGFHGSVKEPERSVITAINNSSANIISVDINSGLNGDNGLCDICIYSDLTISIGSLKPGHFLSQASDVCKKVINCDIGITPIEKCQKIHLVEASDFRAIFAPRLHNSNKGNYGYIGLIGGSDNYSGAIRLANMSACSMRSGSGVVKIAAPSSLGNIIMPSILESTFYPLSDENGKLIFVEKEFEQLLNLSAIAFGMGIGNTDEVKKSLIYLLSNYAGILIIDADGLNALSQMDKSILKDTKAQIVITPHPKEFSRLTQVEVNEILCKPIYHATEFAKKYNIVVLLKGCSTIITNGETSYITNRGSAGMATAGSGDVLSGVIAAVCGYNKDNVLLATVASSYVTGVAGEFASKEYGDISLIASDTAINIAKAIKYIAQ